MPPPSGHGWRIGVTEATSPYPLRPPSDSGPISLKLFSPSPICCLRAEKHDARAIDRGHALHELSAIKQRFLTLNRDRLARMRDSLRARQRDIIDLLPLLF